MPPDTPPSSPEVVDVPFRLTFNAGTLQSVFPVPAAQTTLTGILPILQQFTSGIAGHMAGVLAQAGQPISCGPRCSACCHQLVPISPFEAELLARWISTLPPESQQAIAARFHATMLALQQRGILQQLTPAIFTLPTDEFRQLGARYSAAGVPCPFLLDDMCSIHDIRPAVCREYMVVSPPQFCDKPGDPRVQGVVLPVQPSRALMQLGQRVPNDAQGWLPLVFLFHWIAAGSRPGQSVSGTGPQVLEEFLNALAQQEGVAVSVGTIARNASS